MKNVLAIDIGGSKYIVGIMREDGSLLVYEKYLWDTLTPECVFGSIEKSSKALLAKYPQYKCEAVGATIPGLADPVNGIWVEACFSGIKNLPIAGMLENALDLKAYIDNDTNACTVGEKMYGHAKNISDFVYFTVSNGCGGAIFANNRRYYGGLGNAGEVGHCVVVENGRQCNCSSKGCFEAHASGRAIGQNYIELGGCLIAGNIPTAKQVDVLARGDDKIATAAYDLEGYYIGKVAAMVANIVNPQMIIIGGGVSMGYDLFEKSLLKTVEEQTYRFANRGLRILKTALGYEGALVSAGALAFNGKTGLY